MERFVAKREIINVKIWEADVERKPNAQGKYLLPLYHARMVRSVVIKEMINAKI